MSRWGHEDARMCEDVRVSAIVRVQRRVSMRAWRERVRTARAFDERVGV